MSAIDMFKSMNVRAPSTHKEKHHGNKRRAVQRMKVEARQSERHKADAELRRSLNNINEL